MPASIVHEGWATKQGSKVKNWKRRYFVLRKDNTLSYYADTKDSAFSVSKAKGSMVLAHGVKILPERQCDVSWPVELAYVSASGFGIQTGKRTLFLFCDTQRDAGTWLDILTGLTTFGVLPSALPFDATAPPPSAGVGPQPAVLGPAPTGPLPDLPESSEDEGLDGLARVPTVSLKRKTAKELSQLSRTLLTRTAGQEEQIIGLKAELAASERTCDALRGRVLALETQLRLLSSMPAPPSDSEGEGEGEMEGGGGGGRDGAANPTLHDAAITIQMWWRLIRMRRHFAHVKSLAQVRGRTRTVEARAAGHSDERMPAGRASLSNRNRRTPTWSANIQPLAETSEGRTPLYALARAPKSTQGRIDQPAVPKKMAPRTVAVAPKGVADAEASALAADALTLVPEDAPPPVGSYVSLDKIRERRRLSGVPSEPEGASGAQGQGGDGRAPALDKQAGAEASAAPGLVEPTSSSDASRAAANAAADAHAAAVAAAYAAEQVAPVVLPVESPYDEIVEEDEGRHARLFTLEVSPVAATAGGDDTAVRHARSAMYHFNKRPVKGIKTLISAGLVNGAPEAVAKFICEEPGLSRSAVGDFFGEADEFSQEVLKVYSENFDFTDASLDQSLRLFLLSFRIPGEAQKIERVLTEFSRRFFACNPDIFLHVDTALVLSFSVMMLHTDLHNPSNPRRMTMPEFVRNNRGIDDGQDLPKEYLEMIYRNIEAEEFQCCVDHTYAVEQISKRMQGKMAFPLVTTMRSFITEATVQELFKTKSPNVKRTSTLLLFNDLIVIAARNKYNRRYTLRSSYSLFDVSLRTAAFPGVGECYELVSSTGDELLYRFQTEGPALAVKAREYILQCADVANPQALSQRFGAASRA